MAVTKKKMIPEEQLVFARFQNWAMNITIFVIILLFIVYLSGILPVCVPWNQIPQAWSQSGKALMQRVGYQGGWGWILRADKADVLNDLGVVCLGFVTILSYLSIVPILWKKKEPWFVVIVLLEVILLLLSAAGIFRI